MTTFYVDGSAAGGGDGSVGTPWNSTDQIGTYSSGTGFAAGDIIQFKRGTTIKATSNAISFVNSGSSGNPIIFQDYGSGALPILDCGGAQVTGSWTEQSGNGLPGVYYNNYAGTTINGLTEDSVWLEQKTTLAALTAGTFHWQNAANTQGGVDGGLAVGIYYYPTTGTPASHQIRKCSNNCGINFSNRSYIRFINIHFKGGSHGPLANASTTAQVGIEFSFCKFTELRRATDIGGTLALQNANCKFEDCTVDQCGRGLYFGSQDSGGKNTECVWARNLVTNIDTTGRFSSFVYPLTTIDREALSSQNCVRCSFTDNEVYYGCAAGGISLWINTGAGEFNNTYIARNKIHDIDGAGMIIGAAVTAISAGVNRIEANKIYACASYGIKLNTTQTATSYCINNVIDGCSLGHLYTQTSCSGWVVANNASYNPVTFHTDWGSTSTCTPDYNSYYPATGNVFKEGGSATDFAGFKTAVTANGVTSPDANSITTDPGFISASTRDYRPVAGANIAAAGRPGFGRKDFVSHRFNPTRPDIGAYARTVAINRAAASPRTLAATRTAATTRTART